MKTMKIKGFAAAVLALGLAVGCDQEFSGVAPKAAQKMQAQAADAGSSTVGQTVDVSTNAVVESGAPGSTSAKSGAAKTGGASVNFQASVSVTVNLDAQNGSGQDLFPNASGQFSVAATGTLLGNASSGQITYAVHVVWLTDGVFVDPACGASATVASGSVLDYSLLVQWSVTDDQNWSIQATADVTGTADATVSAGGQTWTVNGSVAHHASAVFSCAAGTYTLSFGVTDHRTLAISNGSESHTVVITATALDHIVIEIDGVAFGPYTLAQVLWWFGFNCNG